MPFNAKVVMFEDNPRFLKIWGEYLENNNHEVVGTAMTLHAALLLISRIETGELEVDVATIDRNLTDQSDSTTDGDRIVAELEAKAPYVKTIGLGSGPLSGVDVDLTKYQVGILAETIDKI